MIRHSLSISISIVFIYINSLIWLAFGLILVFDVHPSLPKYPLLIGGMAILSIIIAGILMVLGFFVARRSRIAFFLTTGLLLFTSLLGIFDDFGLSDLAFLFINIIPLILLIKDRAWYLQNNSHTGDGNSN